MKIYVSGKGKRIGKSFEQEKDLIIGEELREKLNQMKGEE